jgi:hypothetical protein
LTTTTPLPENAITASFLIDESAGLWNANVIRSFFTEETASKILQVPLSRYGGNDFASWPHAKFCIYTVRSAYNLARSESFFATQSSSGPGLSSAVCEEERLWKKLWNVKAPGKMKITLWHLAHDCLPKFQVVTSFVVGIYQLQMPTSSAEGKRERSILCSSVSMPWKFGVR